MIACQKCGEKIETYSPMRKWCFLCRKAMAVERAKNKKLAF